eukprot:gnl/Spiro4/22411_TR11046_c0_g1_i1.p1 gnl/Spiro4/22411_TR11046_c0_g1~~gnl/Spiro4/22411_TR11046_c0_g1_i1.p1  ORF type:complete len:293 (-),score=85.89 gnl/Spiro4/22411_TR11046_c0_g1_i1:97-975(-)
MASVQLEFMYLSRLTKNPIYAEKALKVFDVLHGIQRSVHPGLYPIYVNPNSAQFTNDLVTYGAMGDSFYEYMLKVWLLESETKAQYRVMYDEAVDGMMKHLLQHSTPSGLAYLADFQGGMARHKMDHLVCFASGMLALGARGPTYREHMNVAKELAETCHQMYSRQPTYIAPEYVNFVPGQDMQLPGNGRHYLLRPEALEAFFVLHRLTGNATYQDWAWNIFQSIDHFCKTGSGYSGLADVATPTPPLNNRMESFFLAETLKYLFLIFNPNLLPLSEYVFNTEAHPLPMYTP